MLNNVQIIFLLYPIQDQRESTLLQEEKGQAKVSRQGNTPKSSSGLSVCVSTDGSWRWGGGAWGRETLGSIGYTRFYSNSMSTVHKSGLIDFRSAKKTFPVVPFQFSLTKK